MVGGWLTPRPGLLTPGKETWFPLYKRLVGPQGRSEGVRKMSLPPGFFLHFILLCLYFICTYLSWLSCILPFCLYLHYTTQASMPPAGFELTTPGRNRPQTLALDRSVSGIGWNLISGPSSSQRVACSIIRNISDWQKQTVSQQSNTYHLENVKPCMTNVNAVLTPNMEAAPFIETLSSDKVTRLSRPRSLQHVIILHFNRPARHADTTTFTADEFTFLYRWGNLPGLQTE